MLARVSRVQIQLAQSWDVLSTMTPADYSAFRDALGKSSGFQSLPVPHARVPDRQQESGADRGAPQAHPSSTRSCTRRCTARVSTTRACGCSPGADSRSRPTCSTATGAQPYQENARRARGVARRLSQRRRALGPVRAGRKTRRPRPALPALALRPPEDRRAHHRLQARHGRHERGRPTSPRRWNCGSSRNSGVSARRCNGV